MLSTLYRRGDSLKPRDESSLDVPSRNWTLEFQQALSTRGQDRYEKITSLIDAFVDRARSVAILLIDVRHPCIPRLVCLNRSGIECFFRFLDARFSLTCYL